MENKLLPCPFCKKDWGISDPDTGRHWIQKINYCPVCGHVLNRRADTGIPATEEPLSLGELQKMNGEPVYLVDMEPIEYSWENGWFLVDADEDMAYNDGYRFPLSQCDGFAYRHKPAEDKP